MTSTHLCSISSPSSDLLDAAVDFPWISPKKLQRPQPTQIHFLRHRSLKFRRLFPKSDLPLVDELLRQSRSDRRHDFLFLLPPISYKSFAAAEFFLCALDARKREAGSEINWACKRDRRFGSDPFDTHEPEPDSHPDLTRAARPTDSSPLAWSKTHALF